MTGGGEGDGDDKLADLEAGGYPPGLPRALMLPEGAPNAGPGPGAGASLARSTACDAGDAVVVPPPGVT